MNPIPIVALLFASLLSIQLPAQKVKGCTDSQAVNFNPLANAQDGSCTYKLTVYNPPFKYLLPDEVNETSGLIFFRDGLWTINDSGNDPILYRLDTVTGEVVQRITIGGAGNRDWEDLAQDDQYIYIGDFGNNSGSRKLLDIYRIRKEAVPYKGDAEIKSEKIVFQYPDYKGRPEQKKQTNFDCEAFVVIGDSIHLFSKNWGDQQSKHYRIPKIPGNYVAELLFTFDAKGLITAAGYNAQTNQLVLLGYTKNEWVPFIWLLFDFHDQDFFAGNKRRIDMLNIVATQTEGICFTRKHGGVLTSEGNRLFSQTAYDFNTARWILPKTTVGQADEPAGFDFKIEPETVTAKKLQLIVTSLPDGEYQLELYDKDEKQLPLKKYKLSRKKGIARIKLKTGNLKPGRYSLRLRSEKNAIEHNFIKQ
ncbi:MAG: hypothetical protein L3J31_05580 [Bacteroidales bacterium]|nr:hypothetical protein [Bacteroidales bacterium]